MSLGNTTLGFNGQTRNQSVASTPSGSSNTPQTKTRRPSQYINFPPSSASAASDYRFIASCETRPVLRALVNALPELNVSLNESKGKVNLETMLGGWPVIITANNCIRIGAQLGLANFSINIVPFMDFLTAYISPDPITREIPIKKHVKTKDETIASLRKAIGKVKKYLVPDGLHLDLCLKFKMEVLHYYTQPDTGSDNTIIEEPIHTTDMVAILSTPVEIQAQDTARMRNSPDGHAAAQRSEGKHTVAFNFRVDVFLLDLLDDLSSLKSIASPSEETQNIDEMFDDS